MRKYLLMLGFIFMSTPAFAAETFGSDNLCTIFSTDGAAAEIKYKNKRIIVSGKILSIVQGTKTWRLSFKCGRNTGMKQGVMIDGSNSNLSTSEIRLFENHVKARNDYMANANPFTKYGDSITNNDNHDWRDKYNYGKNLKFSCKYKKHTKRALFLKECNIY